MTQVTQDSVGPVFYQFLQVCDRPEIQLLYTAWRNAMIDKDDYLYLSGEAALES